MKKTLSGIIFSQNGMRLAEKERKKFQTRIPFTLDPGKKILKKNRKKKSKNLKTSFQHYFQPKKDKTGGKGEKKILDLNPVHTRPVEGNFEKNS